MRPATIKRKQCCSLLGVLLFLVLSNQGLFSQAFSDGPIRLRVRVAQVYARDFQDIIDNAENTWKVWVRDQSNLDGQDWRGGNCIQQNPSPGSFPFTSGSINSILFDQTYGTQVPATYELRLDAWEDDCGNRCDFNSMSSNPFDPCFFDPDDARCNVFDFAGQIPWRNNLPGRWNNDGWFDACGGAYRVRMESYWNYTTGNTISNPIDLGTTNCSPRNFSEINANTADYTNTRNNSSADVFYRVVLQQRSSVVISTCNATTNFDSFLRLLNSTGGQIAANDDFNGCGFGGTRSQITTTLDPGTYYVLVEGFQGNTGQFELNVSVTPLANVVTISGLPQDVCVDAPAITMTGSPSGGTFSGPGVSGNSFNPSAAGVGNRTVTYTLTGPGFTDYTVNNVAYGGFVVGGTSVNSVLDDQVRGPFPIDFPFEFYGTTYNQYWISSNGWISFSNPGGNSDLSNDAVPNGAGVENIIAGAWDDLNPQLGGTIGYTSTGTAPNRRHIVTFNGVRHFGSSASVTFQIWLYEENGYIDIRSINIGNDGGGMTQGIENANATLGQAVPGRNNTAFSASNNTWQFRPPNVCGGTVTQNITVNALPSAAFTLPATICIGDDPITIIPTQAGGTFSGSGVIGNSFNPATAGLGVRTVTYSITDNNGCSASSSQNITVIASPTASASGTNETCPGASDGTATATGSGGAGNYTYLWSTGSTSSTIIGLAPGTYTVTVSDGNSCSATASVTIGTNLDTQAPTLVNCPTGTITVNTTAGQCTGTATWTPPTATDNCTVTSLSSNFSPGAIFPLGNTTVTYTAVDQASNSSTCSFVVQVVDVQSPVVTCPANRTENLDASCNFTIPDYRTFPGAGVTDNCDNNLSLSQSPAPGTVISGAGTTQIITFSSTDNSGNSGSCNFTLTLADVTNPVIACPAPITQGTDAGVCGAVVNYNVTFTDNCPGGSVALVSGPASGSTFPVGTTAVTWRATDASGNTDQCTFNVTINDTEAPVARCQNVTVTLGAGGVGTLQPQDVDNGSSDNCGITSLSLSQNTFGCSDLGTQTVTLTVTDAAGNADDCIATVNVVDQIAPVANCRNFTVDLNASGQASITPGLVDNGSTDNCGVTSRTLNISSFNCTNLGANTVTLTVSDASGNLDSCNATVTVRDQIAPVANCQNITVYLDASGSVSITGQDLDNGSADNCGIVSYTASTTSFNCANVGSNSVTLTVADASGNTNSCTATVTVVDSISPVATCQNITVQLDAGGAATITPADINNGSTDACGPLSFALNTTSFGCANVGTNTVTLTVTDANNNSSTCTATVTVEDNVAPVAICRPITIQLDGNGQASITGADINNGSNDACGIDSLIATPSSFTCADTGANTVTLRVVDNNGNANTCTAIVTVEDNTSPVAVCTPFTAYLDANGQVSITGNDVDGGSSDNCGVVSYAVFPNNFVCVDTGANNVQLTVTDAAGNLNTCSTTVTVLDTVSPIALCQNITIQLDSLGNASITPTDVNNGSTDNCAIQSLSVSPNTFDCNNVGANTVTLTVTDVNGNVSTCQSTVTVEDNTAPIARCRNLLVQLDVNGQAVIPAFLVDDNSSDACGFATVAVSPDTLTCADLGFTNLTLTVTDNNGNASSCTSTAFVIDNFPPTMACQDITVYLDGSGSASITASDIDNGSTDACGLDTLFLDTYNFSCANLGANTVTLTARDNNNNQATCTATVTVVDSTSPVITCPAPSTIFVDANCSVNLPDLTGGASATDACGSVTFSQFPAVGTPVTVGVTTVSITAMDGSGNTSSCDVDVTVSDTIAPLVACNNVTIYLDANGAASVTTAMLDGGTTDNCMLDTVFLDVYTFGCSNTGTNTVTLTARDASGNTASCQGTVTVVDSITPTITCPMPSTLYVDGNCQTTLPDLTATSTQVLANAASGFSAVQGQNNWYYGSYFAFDYRGFTNLPTFFGRWFGMQAFGTPFIDNNGGHPGVSDLAWAVRRWVSTFSGQVTISGSFFDRDVNCGDGANVRIFRNGSQVYDFLNIPSTSTAYSFTLTIAVGDTLDFAIDPKFDPGCDDTQFTAEISTQSSSSATDNCGAVTVTQTPAPGTTLTVGITPVTLVAQDASGNLDSCVVNVTVQDSTPPAVVCNNVTAYLDASGNATITVSQVDGGTTDNCGIDTLRIHPFGFTCADLNRMNVTSLTAVDVNGNVSNCFANVTLLDTIRPVMSCQNVTVYLDGNGAASITPMMVNAGSSDNCGIESLALDISSFGCANVGANTVTLTATDSSSNNNSCTATVTVLDTIAPLAVCNSITVQLDASGSATVTAADLNNGSSDICGIDTVFLDTYTFGCNNIGANTVTLTVIDNNGNQSTCTGTVTVEDNVQPVANCNNITVQLDASGNASITAADINNNSTDACGIDTVFLDTYTFACNNVGANTVTLTVIDNNGNQSTCTGTVTVEDNVPPVANCNNITVQLDASGSASITAADINNGSNDACGIDTVFLDTYNFGCSNVGGNTVTLTVVDNNGNQSTCTGTVTVEDNVAPVANCNTITVQLDASGSATITAADIDNNSSDACGIDTVFLDTYTFGCNNIGANTVTLTVIDNNGNQSTCTGTVTVEDNVQPVANCNNITVQLDASGNASITAADINNNSTDACGIDTVFLDTYTFSCNNVGANTVTLTVIDNNGNQSTCTGTVTVEDTVAPIALCNDLTIRLDANGQASITTAQVLNSATDACGIDTASLDIYNFSCSGLGANTVTLTVTDNNGNQSSCTATITVEDTIAPTIACPAPATIYVDDSCMASIPDLTQSSTSVVANATADFSGTQGQGNWFYGSYAAFDYRGFANLPVFASRWFGQQAFGTPFIDSQGGHPGVNDLAWAVRRYISATSGTVTVAGNFFDRDGNCGDGAHVRIFQNGTQVYDYLNIPTTSITYSFQLTLAVGDTLDFVIDPKFDGGCDDTEFTAEIFTQSTAATADNCGPVTVTQVPAAGTQVTVGVTPVTLIATDQSGNQDSCVVNVNVEDIIRPTVVCNNLTVYLDNSGNASITVAQVDGGSFDNCGIDSLSLQPSSTFSCSNLGGSNFVALRAIDVNGNENVCFSNITLLDTIAPVAVCQDLTIYLDANGQASITPQDIDNGSTDNCTIQNLSLDISNFGCSNTGANTVTLTVTDNSNNTTSCTATVTVLDTITPTISCPMPSTLYVDDSCVVSMPDLTGFSSIVLGNSVSGFSGVQGQNNWYYGSYPAFSYRSFTNLPNFFGRWLGTQAFATPFIDGTGGHPGVNDLAWAVRRWISTYNGQVTIAGSFQDQDVNCGDGANVRIFRNGTQVYDYQNIPSTSTPFNLSLNVGVGDTLDFAIDPKFDGGCDATIFAVSIETVTGTSVADNCGNVTVTQNPPAGSQLTVGVTPVTITVTDDSGNSDSCSVNVMVLDTTPPAAICRNVTAYLDASGNASLTVADVDNGSFDNCGIDSIRIHPDGFTCADLSRSNVSGLTVVDVNGNTSMCFATVTLLDTIRPTTVCRDTTLYLDANGAAGITAQDIDNGSFDNCGITSLSLDMTSFGCANVGANTVTLTATDTSNNSNSCTATVTVLDTISPIAICRDLIIQLDASGSAAITAGDVDNGSNDACGIDTVFLDTYTFGCSNVGANTVTLTVVDNNGNQSSCNATITVQDTVPPVASCQNLTIGLDAAGIASITAADINNSNDACGLDTIFLDRYAFGCADVGANTVTLTIVDNNGNQSSCTATVTVIDSIAPVAQCTSITVQLDASGNASITAADINNGSNDACGIDTVFLDTYSFGCSNVGANTVNLTVVDNNGNQSTCSGTVTVEDNVQPVANCNSITVQLDASGSASITAADIDNNSSDACGIDTVFLDTYSFGCSNVGANTVTLTVIDNNGNQSTCTGTVTVEDNVPPVANCNSITVQLDASGNASITAADINNNSTDACGIDTVFLDTYTFGCSNVGANTVTLTVIDNNGNQSTCTGTVTVEDNVPPVANCNSITVQLDASGNASITAADINNNSTDACGIDTVFLDTYTFGCSNVGANTVTLTVIDNNGNQSTCTGTVTVEDNVPPVANCNSITVQLDASGNASITTADIDNNSNDACGIDTVFLDTYTFGCSNVGANTVTLTVIDNNGNQSTCTGTVTVEDNVPPVANCNSITVQLDASGNASITAADINNNSTDACGIDTVFLDTYTFGCSNVGANTVTLTVIDNNGNQSTCTGTVTVEDNVPPVANCNSITVQLDASGNATITAADINNNSTDACGIDTVFLDTYTFGCSNVGANIVTLTVIDNNGNQSTCTGTVTVEDNVPPVANCNSITVQLDASGNASITTADIDNNSNDACGIDTVFLDTYTFNCSNVGANTVTLTVIDNNGNQSTCTGTVTVEDNVPPVANCNSITVQLDASGNASITAADINNNSTDACGIDTVFLDTYTFGCSNVGANTVTLTVIDNNGNQSTCTGTVTVEDNVPPVANCNNLTVQLDASGNASITAADINNNSSDACGIDTVFLDTYTFGCSNVGANTVTLTVIDNNGNQSTCTGTVTVEDNVPPVANCNSITVQLDASGNASITAADINNNSSDACGIDTVFLDTYTFGCSNVGANTVTLTVIDNNGNQSTCTGTVTVEDNVPPVANCNNLTVQLDASGNASITAADINNNSTDACGIDTVFLDTYTFGCSNVGANTVTLTVVDNNGNQSTCTGTVTVEDNVQPVANCNNITVQLDASGNASITAADINNNSTDACGIDTVFLDTYTFSCSNVGANTVTLTVIDNNGNQSTCTGTVTVQDTVPPVATCQNLTIGLDAAGNASITAADINNSNDACGLDTIFLDRYTFGCADVGANTVTLTIVDNNGNQSSCTATVTVIDSISPVALCNSITVQLDASGSATIAAADINNGSTDACGIDTVFLDTYTFGCSNVGSNTVTLTVIDNNGNQSSCTGIVTVEDNVPPVANCNNITVQLDASGNASITTADIDNNSSDACGIDTVFLDTYTFNCSNVGANTVTLTAIDNNGNQSTCTGTVTVEDNVQPVANCNSITVQLDASGNASITAADINNNSTDACGIDTVFLDTYTFGCSNVGANTVTLTVVDNNGNQSTCTGTVTVEDNVQPVANCNSITVQLDASGNASITVADINNNSTDACGIDTVFLDTYTFSCSNVGANTVTLTVVDNNGNQSTCTGTVTVEDNVPPVANCNNITVRLDASGNASIATSDINNGSNDACGLDTLFLDTYTFGCSNVGANTVTLTVIDNNGNQSTCTGTVTVEDTVAPIAICRDLTVQLDTNGQASITAADVNNGSNDACGIDTVFLDQYSFGCNNKGGNTVTLTVVDNNGNSSNCTATITIQDTVKPLITCPIPAVLYVDDSCSVPLIDLTASTVVPITNATLQFSQTQGAGGWTFGTWTGTTYNTYTNLGFFFGAWRGFQTASTPVVDSRGGTPGLDNGSPSVRRWISSYTGNVIIEGEYFDRDTACGDGVTLFILQNGVQKWTTTNVTGAMATYRLVLSITAGDTMDFVINSNQNPQCDETEFTIRIGEETSPLVSDNCGAVTLTQSPAPGTPLTVGTYPVTITATDAVGNFDTCVVNIQVQDTTPPTPVCLAVDAYLDSLGVAVVTAAVIDGGTFDNCTLDSVKVRPLIFTCSDLKKVANVTTLSAVDIYGNSSFCFSRVTLLDTIRPTAVCQNLTVYLDANGQASILPQQVDASSDDNCGIEFLTLDDSTFTCADIGANTVTLTAIDSSGNSGSCQATITVLDTINPVAVCQDIAIQLDGSGSATITAADINNGSSDACGIDTVFLDQYTFSCNAIGGNTVTLTVIDNNGNQSSCTATVTILDTVPPVASCNNITVQLDASGAASITTADINNGSSDACGVDTVFLDTYTFGCSNVGANTVTLTVVDNNGNQSTCTSTVTVEDNVAPVANCNSITVQLDASGNATITTADINNGSSDACGIDTVFLDTYTFSCNNVGANTVTLTVIDNNGNQSTCTGTVTVEDNIAPVANCNSITVQLDASGSASITTADINNGSSDACGIDTVFLDTYTFGCSNVGSNTVTLTVIDNNGNQSTCTGTVTVEDNVAPVANCNSITVQLDASGSATITAADINNGSSDACGIDTVFLDTYTFGCSNVGSNTVTLTVIDNNGNQSTCTGTVTVEDNVAPVANCNSITVQLDASGSATITAADINNGSSDACGIDTLFLDTYSFGCGNVGANTVTLTVIDNNGNQSSCTGTVTVVDSTSPVALCNSIDAYLDASGQVSITPMMVDGGSSDACGIASRTLDVSSFDCNDVGANTVTLTVTDNNNNSSSCQATVTVIDSVAPVASCNNLTLYLGASGSVSITAQDVDNGSSDACGILSLSLSQTTFSCSDAGTNNVVLTVTDNNNNSSTCTSVVTILDTVAPAITCPSDISVLADTGQCGANVTIPVPTISDNCGGTLTNNITGTANASGFYPVGSTVVTWTVSDGSGNSRTCSITVTVTDNQAPVLTNCPQNIFVTTDSTDCTPMVFWTVPTATDACGIDTLISNFQPGARFPIGNTPVTYTAIDSAGNQVSCSFLVIVRPKTLVVTLSSPAGACGANISCAGAADGAINSNVSGGCLPYTYQWSNGATTANLSGVSGGVYRVTVTDGRGAIATALITLNEPAPLAIQTTVTNAQCSNIPNGSITTIVSGGAVCSPYTYSWTGPNGFTSTSQNLSNLANGTYVLTVTDANGCTDTTSAVVNSNPPPAFTISGGGTYCKQQPVQVCVVANNGPNPSTWSYLWNTGRPRVCLNNSGGQTRTFYVTVTDNSTGCTAVDSVTIEREPRFTARIDCCGDTAITCGDMVNIPVSVVNGGTTPFTLTYTDGNGLFTVTGSGSPVFISVSPTVTTTYSLVSINSANGCAGNVCGQATIGVNCDTATSSAPLVQVIDFDVDPNNNSLLAGTEITNQYSSIGLTITADNNTSSHPDKAIIFDGNNPSGQDEDLGSPNQAFGGPGIGAAGGPGQPGENNTALGNVLIVAEDDVDANNDGRVDDPDDEANGGQLNFNFSSAVDVAYITLVDVESGNTLELEDANGNVTVLNVPGLGDNAVLRFNVSRSNIVRMTYDMPKSGGVADIGLSPTCDFVLDFNNDANGDSLQTGEEVSNQWASLGVRFAFTNNVSGHPDKGIIFNSSAITGGDDDLGTPNQDFNGPGQGSGGEQGAAGENNTSLGKLIIIAEDDVDANNDGLVDDPDDEAGGGEMEIIFDNATFVSSLTLVDVDDSPNSQLLVTTASGQTFTVPVQNLGNNSVQEVGIFRDSVANIKVQLGGGAGLANIRYCLPQCTEPNYYADVVSRTRTGSCRTVVLDIACQGSGQGLDYIDISVPCGSVSNVSNSLNLQTALISSDPQSGVTGIRIFNVPGCSSAGSNFTVSYTICRTSGCSFNFCDPLLAFGKGSCVFYREASGIPSTKQAPAAASSEEESGQGQQTAPDNISVVAFPNPTTGQVTLAVDVMEMPANAVVRVTDLAGHQIEVRQVDLGAGRNELNFKLDNLANGVYQIILETEGRKFVEKVVKH